MLLVLAVTCDVLYHDYFSSHIKTIQFIIAILDIHENVMSEIVIINSAMTTSSVHIYTVY